MACHHRVKAMHYPRHPTSGNLVSVRMVLAVRGLAVVIASRYFRPHLSHRQPAAVTAGPWLTPCRCAHLGPVVRQHSAAAHYATCCVLLLVARRYRQGSPQQSALGRCSYIAPCRSLAPCAPRMHAATMLTYAAPFMLRLAQSLHLACRMVPKSGTERCYAIT